MYAWHCLPCYICVLWQVNGDISKIYQFEFCGFTEHSCSDSHTIFRTSGSKNEALYAVTFNIMTAVLYTKKNVLTNPKIIVYREKRTIVWASKY